MYEIGEYIKKEELTQVQAADLMGVKQPRISNLINGKIKLFTIDMIITMLAKACLKVERKNSDICQYYSFEKSNRGNGLSNLLGSLDTQLQESNIMQQWIGMT